MYINISFEAQDNLWLYKLEFPWIHLEPPGIHIRFTWDEWTLVFPRKYIRITWDCVVHLGDSGAHPWLFWFASRVIWWTSQGDSDDHAGGFCACCVILIRMPRHSDARVREFWYTSRLILTCIPGYSDAHLWRVLWACHGILMWSQVDSDAQAGRFWCAFQAVLMHVPGDISVFPGWLCYT